MSPEDQETDLRKLFEVWVSSERKAQIVFFFHKNPGIIETLDGLARRLGIDPDALRGDIEDHVRLGVLKKRELGGKTVIMYDRSRRNNIEQLIESMVRRQEESL